MEFLSSLIVPVTVPLRERSSPFTKALAIDHGREGIRVHAICPGYINAGLAEGYFESQPDPAKRAKKQALSTH